MESPFGTLTLGYRCDHGRGDYTVLHGGGEYPVAVLRPTSFKLAHYALVALTHFDSLRKTVEALVCPTCHSRIGHTGEQTNSFPDSEHSRSCKDCVSCLDIRNVLSQIRELERPPESEEAAATPS